jgi:hypothetical protein
MNCLVSIFCLAAAIANAEDVMVDGDMEELTVGTNPDEDVPAGSWYWPENYIIAGYSELVPEIYQVVETGSFDEGASGNSLALLIPDPDNQDGTYYLPSFLSRTIDESEGIVTLTFDIWVGEDGDGGSIFIGGDHGGGGFTSVTDRGPQISWSRLLGDTSNINTRGVDDDGNIIDTVLLEPYPYNAWQSVRIVMDLQTDRFDFYHGLRDEELALLGEQLYFRANKLDHLDRFTFVEFELFVAVESYIDNIRVVVGEEEEEVRGDSNCDGGVDFDDIDCFVSALIGEDSWNGCGHGENCTYAGANDINQDGSVDFDDIDPFVECLINGGCP